MNFACSNQQIEFFCEKVTSKRTPHEHTVSEGKISSEVMLVRLAEDKFYVVSYPEQDQCCWGEYVFGAKACENQSQWARQSTHPLKALILRTWIWTEMMQERFRKRVIEQATSWT